jgi:amidase
MEKKVSPRGRRRKRLGYSAAMQLSDLDATGCAELIAKGAISPAEVVAAAIDRVARHDHELGTVVTPLFDDARRAAQDPPAGPFRGVPILIKDLVATVGGAPQSNGLAPLKHARHVAAADSHLVRKLRAAGFVVIGKSNTSELGILPSAEPPPWPPTRNPYDRARTSGGSSGGSASATASGLVPIGHANDGGGSIRIPASCCGLFGLKPSRARVSLGPHLGDVNGGLVCEHVVTRSVRDSAAVLDLLAGMELGDPYCAPAQATPYAAELAAPPPRGLRIGFATRYLNDHGVLTEAHPDAIAAVAHAAKLLGELGHHVEPAEIAALHDPGWVPNFLAIWVVGVATELRQNETVLGRPILPHEVELLTWTLGELGKLINAPAYAAAWRWVHAAARRVAAYWTTRDLWLTPTVTTPPPLIGTFRSDADDPMSGIFRAADFAPFTAPFNATGQPACSLPLYRSAAGLPIGVQLVAAYGREDLLLRVAAQLEAAQPFTHPMTRR